MATLFKNSNGTWNYGTQTFGTYGEAKRAQEEYERIGTSWNRKNQVTQTSGGSTIGFLIKAAILIGILIWCRDHLAIVIPVAIAVIGIWIYFLVKKSQKKNIARNWNKINSYPEGQEDYAEIIRLLKENDTKYNDLESTFSLFSIYANGIGTEPDLDAALNYLKKSAEKGCLDGKFNYGLYYLWNKEDATEEEKKLGFKYLEGAAKSNRDDIMFELAMAYYYGNGVQKDEDRGLRMIKKLAGKGFQDAQEFLNEDDIAGKSNAENMRKNLGEPQEGYTFVDYDGKTFAVSTGNADNYYCPKCYKQVNPNNSTCNYCNHYF